MPFLNKVNTISNKVLTLLLGSVLTGSLINSKLFVYPSLTAYFFFAVLIAGLAVVSGVILLVRYKEQGFSLTFPVFIFLTLIVYSCLHGLFLHGYLNFRHIYLLLCGLLFLSAICIFCINGFNYKTLFIIIGLLGVIESLWCLLQYIGLIDSANTYFSVSGSWVNPNVTAMFLAMCFPVLLALRLTYKGILRKVISASIILVLVALVLLNCRTAYIGAGTAIMLILNYRFGIIDWLKMKKNRPQSLFIIIFGLLVLIPIGIKLYGSKKESADGRLLIWKISAEMIAQKPLSGYGYGMFEREYNLEQAKFISNGNVSNRELKNAGHVNMAYNEFLQNTLEGGVVGFILFTALILSLLLLPIFKGRYQIPFNHLIKIKKENQSTQSRQFYLVAAYTGIATFTIMSLINFTIDAIPVMCLFIIFAAILSANSFYINTERGKTNSISSILKSVLIPSGIVRPIVIILIGSSLYIGYKQVNLASALFQNKVASDLINQKQYNKAFILLLNLRESLKYSEGYWQNLGNLYYEMHKYEEAAKALEHVKIFTTNPVVYLGIGKCYERIGKYKEAEANYLSAVNLEPSHFTSRYKLMKLYISENNIQMTLILAKSIVDLKPKINSREVRFFKAAAYNVMYSNDRTNKSLQNMKITKHEPLFSLIQN